jgi:hypothetical protein
VTTTERKANKKERIRALLNNINRNTVADPSPSLTDVLTIKVFLHQTSTNRRSGNRAPDRRSARSVDPVSRDEPSKASPGDPEAVATGNPSDLAIRRLR